MSNILLSDVARGLIGLPHPQVAGVVVTVRSTFTFAAAMPNTQILEIGALPNHCILTEYELLMEGTMTGLTANVGILSGDFGQNVAGRSLTANMFSAVDLTVALSRPTINSGLLLTPTDSVRGIGFQPSGTITAGGGRRATLIWSYTAAH